MNTPAPKASASPETLPAKKQPTEYERFRTQLDNIGGDFKNALPAHIPAERFARVVLTAVQQNPELLECDRKSLWGAAMKAAQDGLLPDGRDGAMVVRRAKGGGKAANWQPMIAGIRKKARNSGEISTWDAQVVRRGDNFQFQLGDSPQINHSYDLSVERGDVVGAYSVALLKDGSRSFEVMSIGEIHAIRDRSDAWKAFKAGIIKTTPWSTDEAEMCRKTVARRHSKVLPMSSDLDDLVRRDDELYQFGEAKAEAVKSRPKSLTSKLDAIAGIGEPVHKEIESIIDDAEGTTIDHETGEVLTKEYPVDTRPVKSASKPRQKKESPAAAPAAAAEPGPAPAEPGPANIPNLPENPHKWTDFHCAAYGKWAAANGRGRAGVVPPELRGEEEADRADIILRNYDYRAEEIAIARLKQFQG